MVNYERTLYEGFAPHRVPVIVECLTDNLNRTVAEIRVLFRKGQLGTSGSVSWDFDHLGMIEAEPNGADADRNWPPSKPAPRISKPVTKAAPSTPTPPTWTPCKALPEFGFTVASANLGYKAKNPVALSGAELEEVEAFLDALDNHDDVQNIYVGLQAN